MSWGLGGIRQLLDRAFVFTHAFAPRGFGGSQVVGQLQTVQDTDAQMGFDIVGCCSSTCAATPFGVEIILRRSIPWGRFATFCNRFAVDASSNDKHGNLNDERDEVDRATHYFNR